MGLVSEVKAEGRILMADKSWGGLWRYVRENVDVWVLGWLVCMAIASYGCVKFYACECSDCRFKIVVLVGIMFIIGFVWLGIAQLVQVRRELGRISR